MTGHTPFINIDCIRVDFPQVPVFRGGCTSPAQICISHRVAEPMTSSGFFTPNISRAIRRGMAAFVRRPLSREAFALRPRFALPPILPGRLAGRLTKDLGLDR